MKNFLLVVPRFAKPGEYYNFPLGLAYISSYLKSRGFNIFCLNLCHTDKPLDKILELHINEKNIDILCTGGMSFNWDQIEEVLNVAKKIKPEIITVAGGAVVISDPELALRNMKIDYGILGEGELTMAELADHLCKNSDPKKIDGITYLDRKLNRVVTNPSRNYVENLDDLPFPDYEAFGFAEWTKLMQFSGNFDVADKFDDLRYVQMIGSRSCPFSCTFCYHHLGQRYRERSIDNIFEEIDYLIKKYNVNFLYFLDELLSAKEERLLEFARRLKDYPIYGWAGSFRVNNVKLETLKILRDSKLILMGYGIENINDSILKSMNKKITREEVEHALKTNREAKLYCTGNIILGDPAETKETLKSSLDYWLEHPEYNLNLVFLMPIPDSKIYRQALEKNLIKDKLGHIKTGFPAVNLTSLTDDEFFKFQSMVGWMKYKKMQMKEGELVESKHEGEVKCKKKYLVKVRCPFCLQISKHIKLEDNNSWFTPFVCEHCASPNKIKSAKIFYENKNLFNRWLNYISLFFLAYFSKYKLYRENKIAAVKIMRKIKSFILFPYKIVRTVNN